MNKQQLEKNIKEIIELYNNLQKALHSHLKWVKEKCREREILNEFLEYIWIENNEETSMITWKFLKS